MTASVPSFGGAVGRHTLDGMKVLKESTTGSSCTRMGTVEYALQLLATPTATADATGLSTSIPWCSERQDPCSCPPAPRRAPPAVLLVPVQELSLCCRQKVVAVL